MAKQYILTNSFTPIDESSGTIQNMADDIIEIVSAANAFVGQGLRIAPHEKIGFSGSIKARSLGADAVINVVDFNVEGGGGDAYNLPVATSNTLGGVKSSNGAGAVSVDENGIMRVNPAVVDALIAPEWDAGRSYAINTLVAHSGSFYMCTTAHTSGTFADDLDDGYWNHVDSGASSSNQSGMYQLDKINVTASTASPMIVDIPINRTTQFCLPHIDVLKYEAGLSNVAVTAFGFNNADASDFVYNQECVAFDGTMHIKTSHSVSVSAPVALVNGYVSESAIIDVSNYTSVKGVEVK